MVLSAARPLLFELYGAIRCGDQQAGCDRVIRDRRGNSVCGFAKAGVGNK
jgi:hypothetical protein